MSLIDTEILTIPLLNKSKTALHFAKELISDYRYYHLIQTFVSKSDRQPDLPIETVSNLFRVHLEEVNTTSDTCKRLSYLIGAVYCETIEAPYSVL